MTPSMLRGIDYARHLRWLNRTLGAQVDFFVLDAGCATLWNPAQPVPERLRVTLAGVRQPDASALHLVHLAHDQSVLCRAFVDNLDQLCGWGCLRYDPGPAQAQPARLEELALPFCDTLDAISTEHLQRIELEMMSLELGARYEELHLFYRLDQQLQSHGGDYRQVLQGLMEATVAHLDVDLVAFVQAQAGESFHASGADAPVPNLDLVLVQLRGDLFRFVQASNESLVLNLADDPRRGFVFTGQPFKLLASPVGVGGQMDAMVVLLKAPDKPDFTNSDRRLAEVLANQLASLGVAYQLVGKLRHFNAQIARALTEAVEAKDPYTRGHSERVSAIALEIGRRMGLPEDELEELRWGSLLHDVGKIGMPDAILNKPAALTEDEYTFTKAHAERGYDILKHMNQLTLAATAVRHHHERFDGKGYPGGLQGDRIPLLARIIAVADTYDSITSSRAHQPARTHEAALRELDRVAGTQLDPAVVAVLVALAGEEPAWLQTFKIRREVADA